MSIGILLIVVSTILVNAELQTSVLAQAIHVTAGLVNVDGQTRVLAMLILVNGEVANVGIHLHASTIRIHAQKEFANAALLIPVLSGKRVLMEHAQLTRFCNLLQLRNIHKN